MQMTNVSTVVGYLNYLQDAIGSSTANGSDIFSSYGTEIALASTPDQLVDRINLLLMAGEMDGNLQTEILSAVNAIPSPPAIRTPSTPRSPPACKPRFTSPWPRQNSLRSSRSPHHVQVHEQI